MRKFIFIVAAVLTALCAQAITNEELVEIQKTKKYTELWGQRATLFNTLGCDSTSIVMLGNSLTHGDEWHELFNDHRILNRGINGDVIQGIADRLDAVVDGHPAKIFLLSGTNDVSHNLSADSIAEAAGKLIDLIRERTPQTKLYVQSIFPINNVDYKRYKAMFGKDQVIRDINVRLKEICKEKGVTFIDVYPHLADENGNLRKDITNDGLHLLGKGYLIWRDVLDPYIKE